MTNQSPTIPPTAVSLWLAEGQIHMDLPAINGHTTHRLTFPNDAIGMTRALYLLQQRNQGSYLATEGDITQHQLDRKVRNMKAKLLVDAAGERLVKKSKDSFSPTLRQSARDVMRRLGLR